MAEKRAIIGIINYLWIRKKLERMNIFEENQLKKGQRISIVKNLY
jgi:hypothetical protein